MKYIICYIILYSVSFMIQSTRYVIITCIYVKFQENICITISLNTRM